MGREVPVHKRNVPLVRDCHFRPVSGVWKCYTGYGVISVARFTPVMSDNFRGAGLYLITGGEKIKNSELEHYQSVPLEQVHVTVWYRLM